MPEPDYKQIADNQAKEIARLRDVLIKIAKEDWRGNKPAHVEAAQRALEEDWHV